MNDEALLQAAREARERSYAPYSDFAVGAALLTADGSVFTGVNVENASIGLSVCAERNAIAKAISEGHRDFVRMAIVTGSPHEPTMPCGVCRQVIWEFSHDIGIVVEAADGTRVETTIAELLPMAFTSFEGA